MPDKYHLKTGQSADLANASERRIYRFFEILPGTLAWTTLALIVLLSWQTPVFIAIFIIIFDIYWLLKTVFLSFHLRSTFSKLRRNQKIDWIKKLNDLRLTTNNEKNVIGRQSLVVSHWRDVYHLVIFPFYKEGPEIIRGTFESLVKSGYPSEKLIVVLAAEQRAGEEAQKTAAAIQKEFADKFFRFLVTVHPADIEGEIPGKGSNETWAGRQAKEKIIDPLGIPYENVVVSVFDVDTRVTPGFFGCLSYHYLTCEKPLRSSFQPVPFFTNNIWEAPAVARVISFSATFWHMMQQARPERLTTFSSHSMGFKPLVDVDFWQTNIVSEDSRIFWQCFLRFDGDWRVVPLNYSISMDANMAPTLGRTLINQYKQQRRWGWGAENIPYLLFGLLKNKAIGFGKKLYWAFSYVEGFHSWSTNAIIIFLLGWLPLMLGGAEFNVTLLSYNLPKITRWIMTFAMVGMVSSAVLSIFLLPPRPPKYGKYKVILMVLQWFLLPLTIIVFGCFPGLEAQTRLALGGKYRLGFWVTPKHRES